MVEIFEFFVSFILIVYTRTIKFNSSSDEFEKVFKFKWPTEQSDRGTNARLVCLENNVRGFFCYFRVKPVV